MKKLLYLLFVCMLAIALLSSCTSTDDAEPVVCSSYLLAVENGYTGTEEEWVSDILLEVDQLLRESGKAADAEACGKLFGELFLFVETCFDVSTDGEEKSYVLKDSMTPESVLENAEKIKRICNRRKGCYSKS